MLYNNCVFISDHLICFRVNAWPSSCFELLCGILFGQNSHTVHYVPKGVKN